MTVAGPKGKATLQKRRNEHGEYVVRFYKPDGTRHPDGDYFSDDYTDAYNTAHMLVGCMLWSMG